MKIQRFLVKGLISALLMLFIVSTTRAEVSFNQARGIYAATKDRYKYISPFWAMVAVHSGLLEHIRFFGFYKRDIDQKYDEALLGEDGEKDSIAELLLKLFPSPDGRQFVANGYDDFFKELSEPKNLVQINNIIAILLGEENRQKEEEDRKKKQEQLDNRRKNKREKKKEASEKRKNKLDPTKLDQGYKKEEEARKKREIARKEAAEAQKQKKEELEQLEINRNKEVKDHRKNEEEIIKKEAARKKREIASKKKKISLIIQTFTKKGGAEGLSSLLVDAYEQQVKYANPKNIHQQRYPQDIVIISLLSFVVKVAKDKNYLIDSLPLFFDKDKIVKIDLSPFTKEEYLFYKANEPLLDQIIQNSELKDENIELTFLMAKGFDFYDRIVVEPITFIHDRVFIEKATRSFSDCGETALRNFFMLLLSAGNSGIVPDSSLDSLEDKILDYNSSINAEQLNGYRPYTKFKEFINNHRDIKEGTSETVHNAWAEVVANLNEDLPAEGINRVQYGNKTTETPQEVYEIICYSPVAAATGIINMFNVIARIIPDEVLKESWPTNEEERYELVSKKLDRLCALFSRDGIELSWENLTTSNTTINSEFTSIIFIINDQKAFEWSFEKIDNRIGHFNITRVDVPDEDWRTKFSYHDFQYQYPNDWIASLFPRGLDVEQEKQYAEKFPIIVIYNSSLRTSEGINRTIEIMLNKKMKHFYPLISRWTHQSVQPDSPILFINIIDFLGKLSEQLKGIEIEEKEKEKEKEVIEEKIVIDKVIENTIDIANQKGMLQHNIVVLALGNHHLNAAKLLINHRANLTATAENGNSPLHFVVLKENMEMLDILISSGVDIDAQNKYGQTPLHFAITTDNEMIIERLISAGADIEVLDNYGRSYLDLAAVGPHLEAVKILLKYYTNVNSVNQSGATPLILITQALGNIYEEKYIEIIKLLIKAGAEINAKDNFGLTGLDYAEEKEHQKIQKFLISHGAKRGREL